MLSQATDKAPMQVARRRRLWAGAVAGAAIAHSLPSVLILPTFFARPPTALPAKTCRWRAKTHRPEVALTFDDGPSNDTPRTLDLLDELGFHATFFVLASQMLAYPDMTREIVSRGHEVASHGFAHCKHLLSTPRVIRQDFSDAMTVHHDLLGSTPRFYRPPYGQLSAVTLLEARRHGMEVVLWSRWGKEFGERSPEPVLRRLEPGLTPGAIVLLHDNDVSCRAGTGDLVRKTLPSLRWKLEEKGLDAVTLDHMTRPSDPTGKGPGPLVHPQ
jgi:peptidoglycan-N-acetylglucosamine deacetylase